MKQISRELFKETLQFIQDKRVQENKLCDVLEEMSPGFRCDALVFAETESLLVKLLASHFYNATETLEYYLYEFLEYNEEERKTMAKTDCPEFASEDALYDYLCGLGKTKKNTKEK